jgi:oligopeptidase A
MGTADNPLFAFGKPPRFDQVRAEHVEPAITELIRRQNEGLAALERTIKPTWQGSVAALRRLVEPLGFAWAVVEHLMSVRNSDALRDVQGRMQGEVVASFTRIGQSEPIFRALTALRDSTAWSTLDGVQQRIVTAAIREAEHQGVGLSGAARERFNAIQIELADLCTHFDNNLLDSDRDSGIILRSRDEVDGLPASLLAVTAQGARRNGFPDATTESGPWRISTETSIANPFLQHSRRRDLRERLYRAVITRAAKEPRNNQPVLARVLELRREQAKLLGFATYAELSVSKKMAGSVAAAERLLDELRSVARPRARQELDELTEFARGETGDRSLSLAHWDIGFWSERMRERRYDYNEEALRPYFPLPQVLEGLFALAHRLFGVKVVAADGHVPVWHPDVRFFRVLGETGAPIAAFYLDAYSRPEDKRGGAWMNNCLDRERLPEGLRVPLAYLVCNQNPPADDAPSLMTFLDVLTLFHEFGHGLQHMLTTVEHADAAGINNVEWDAVELPSQFMENWCYHKPTLLGFARHYRSGEKLPDELFERVSAARHFRNGSAMLRQIFLSAIDLELYHRYDPQRDDVVAFSRTIARDNMVLMPLDEDRFLCGFAHIVSGGYAAGYYSYKWAEVLSADAFSAFDEAGLDDPAAIGATGRRFRDTVLALGGGEHPMEVFKAFRGREPSTKALLKYRGLI